MLALLGEIAQRTYLSVELGLQTIHNRSLDWMNRGHHHDAFVDAMSRARGRDFEICAHAILGLPGESHDDMLATAREIARLGLDAVKIQQSLCGQETRRWPIRVAKGEVRLMDRGEYVTTLVDFLELLPQTCVVERLSGEAPPQYFIGPDWCLDKPAPPRGDRRGIRTARYLAGTPCSPPALEQCAEGSTRRAAGCGQYAEGREQWAEGRKPPACAFL